MSIIAHFMMGYGIGTMSMQVLTGICRRIHRKRGPGW